MSKTAEALRTELTRLKEAREAGTLSLHDLYGQLLDLARELAASLREEVPHLDEAEVRRQIPLVLLFLEDQIARLTSRER